MKGLNIKVFVLSFVLGCVLLSFLFGMVGCVSAPPDRKNFSNEACYLAAYCLYLNKENPDKSSCKDLTSEGRSFLRYLFCLDPKNRAEKMNFDDCWKTLNQK